MGRQGLLGWALWASLCGLGCGEEDDASTGLGPGEGSVGAQPAGAEDEARSGAADIVDTAVAAGFGVLGQALADADLVDTLKGEGPFTVFAPTDEAFAALPAGTLQSLTTSQLRDILLYHVVPGQARAADLDGRPLTTAAGYSALLDLSDGVRVNQASVTQADVEASNGVIHVIDQVLLPPDLVQAATLAGDFNTLASALTSAGLVETLSGDGPFTVFAPTDGAFGRLPEGTVEGMDRDTLTQVLTYHVVSGALRSSELEEGAVATLQGGSLDVQRRGGVTVNGAKVTLADVVTTNGVLHVIDAVLVPGS